MVNSILKQLAHISPDKCIARLLAAGYEPESEDAGVSTDERRRRGALMFVKRGPDIPLDQTETFRALPKRLQNRDRAWAKRHRQEGEALDRIVVPFLATYKLGRPRAPRTGERV